MDTPVLNALLIDEISSDARAIDDLLSVAKVVDFQLKCVDCLSNGLVHIQTHRVDIVLLDLGQHTSSGLGGFQRLREAAPSTPVVVLSDVGDEKLAI